MPDEPRLASESVAGQRPYQEDAVVTRTLADGRVLVAVADGMGGHVAGEVASALAVETLESALEDGITLDRAFEMANARVYEEAADPGKRGMGTTLTAALVDDGEFTVANVGDSRGYILTDGGIRQLTEDHSFVAEAMKRGQSEEQAMDTPYKHALTRSIGTGPQVDVDVFGPFPIKSGTALLVCSDGLYKSLDGEDVRRIYVEAGSPQGGVQALVATALERGSDDNISVAVAEYGEVPRAAEGLDPETEDAETLDADTVIGDAPAAAPPEPRLDTHAEARQEVAADDDVGVAPTEGRPPVPMWGVVGVVLVVLLVVLWTILG